MRQILPGPPLSKDTPITALLAKNVTVAIGTAEKSLARNTMLEIAWVGVFFLFDSGGLTCV